MLILAFLFLVLTQIFADEMCSSCGRPDQQRFIYQVAEHNCPCHQYSAGTLRFHENRIQFCNGTAFVDLGVSSSPKPIEPEPPQVPALGTKENPAKSCQEILGEDR